MSPGAQHVCSLRQSLVLGHWFKAGHWYLGPRSHTVVLIMEEWIWKDTPSPQGPCHHREAATGLTWLTTLYLREVQACGRVLEGRGQAGWLCGQALLFKGRDCALGSDSPWSCHSSAAARDLAQTPFKPFTPPLCHSRGIYSKRGVRTILFLLSSVIEEIE